MRDAYEACLALARAELQAEITLSLDAEEPSNS
jgi:hypothetical protein